MGLLHTRNYDKRLPLRPPLTAHDSVSESALDINLRKLLPT